MNERIKQLSQQANDYADSLELGGAEWCDAWEAKFAELLVKMCADAADMAYDARCEYVGDYVAEYMGYGEEQGITAWRMAK
jgi:hypothetical protein